MLESWKQIEGYEGLYEISSKGKIKGLKYNRIKKPVYNEKGYETVMLYKNGKHKNFRVHRLVAEHFLGKQEGKVVDHINFNRKDNRVENLQWMEHKDNLAKTYEAGRGNDTCRKKKIRCIETQKEYDSINECAKDMGICANNIPSAIKGLSRKKVSGYTFEYIE